MIYIMKSLSNFFLFDNLIVISHLNLPCCLQTSSGKVCDEDI